MNLPDRFKEPGLLDKLRGVLKRKRYAVQQIEDEASDARDELRVLETFISEVLDLIEDLDKVGAQMQGGLTRLRNTVDDHRKRIGEVLDDHPDN